MTKFGLDPSLLTISFRGTSHKLRPKTFRVLEYLLEQRGRTVGKQELIGAVWAGAAVSDDVLVQSIAELRRVIEEDRNNPTTLITVPRLGYRLIAEPEPAVVAESPALAAPSPEAAAIPAATVPQRPPPRFWYLLAIAVLLAAGVGLWLSSRPSAHAEGAGPVVVLPLENLSATPELDWLREGLADMLITSLSQISGLTVLSRQEVKSQLDRLGIAGADSLKKEDLLRVSGRTHAGALVKGAFSSLAGHLRVDLQVLEPGSGRILGAESLTVESSGQLLARIDELAVGTAGRLGKAYGGRLATAMTGNLEAYRLYSLGLEKASAYRNREAIEMFQRAVKLDPEFAMAHARTGYAYTVTWNLAAEARPHLQRAFALSSRLSAKDRQFLNGWYAIANLDYPRAVETFRSIVAKHPGEIEAHVRLGHLLRGEARLVEALGVAEAGLVRDPEAPELHELAAGVLAQLGRHQEAIAAAKRFVEMKPLEASAHDVLGEMFQWAGKPGEAMASYQRALELAPSFERPAVHLGNLYFQLGRYRDAIRQFERYIEIAPSELERGRGWGRIAWVHWRRGDRLEAARAARIEMKMVPSSVWNTIVLALAVGDSDAVARLRPRLDEFPYTSRGARTGLRYRDYFEGYIALEQGRTEEAIKAFQQAVRRPAPYWSIDPYEDCLAEAYLKLGRLPEAIVEYRRALTMNPGNARARRHLAAALERSGRGGEARVELGLFRAFWVNADPGLAEMASVLDAPVRGNQR